MSLIKKFNFTSEIFEGLTIVCAVVDIEHENLVIHAQDNDHGNKLILWDVANNVLLKSINATFMSSYKEVFQYFNTLTIKDNKIFFSCASPEIVVYALSENDIKQIGEVKDTIDEKVSGIACHGDVFVSCYDDSYVIAWDLNNNLSKKFTQYLDTDTDPDYVLLTTGIDFDGEHVVVISMAHGYEGDVKNLLQIFNINERGNVTTKDLGDNIDDVIVRVKIIGDIIITVQQTLEVKYWSKSLELIKTVTLNKAIGFDNVIILKDFVIADTTSGRLTFNINNAVNIFSLKDDGDIIETIDNGREYKCLISDGENILVASGGDGMQIVDLFDVSEDAFSIEKYIEKVLNELKDPSVDLKTIDTRNIARYVEFAYLPQELKEKLKDDNGEYECPILKIPIKNDTMIAESDCNHVMSREAFDGWLDLGTKTCPICRQKVDYLKKLTRRDRIIEKVLNEWEKKLNKARDEFLNFTSVGMSATDILNYAKQHKDNIIMQDFENKETMAAMEIFKWQLLVETNNQQSGSMVLTGANIKNLPPIRIVRPNI